MVGQGRAHRILHPAVLVDVLEPVAENRVLIALGCIHCIGEITALVFTAGGIGKCSADFAGVYFRYPKEGVVFLECIHSNDRVIRSAVSGAAAVIKHLACNIVLLQAVFVQKLRGLQLEGFRSVERKIADPEKVVKDFVKRLFRTGQPHGDGCDL